MEKKFITIEAWRDENDELSMRADTACNLVELCNVCGEVIGRFIEHMERGGAGPEDFIMAAFAELSERVFKIFGIDFKHMDAYLNGGLN